MVHWLESVAGNREDTGSAEAHTTDHHSPWLELGTLLVNKDRRVHTHIHGDTKETHYHHKLPVKMLGE